MAQSSAESTPTFVIQNGSIPARFFATRRTQAGFTPAAVTLAGARILAVDQAVTPTRAGATAHLDATGCTVLPGFIDLHIHGMAGHDVMDASPMALAAMARALPAYGVSAFLPTTMTAPHAATLAAVRNVAAWIEPTAARAADAGPESATGPTAGARILGVHLEGPYISPDFPGAQLTGAIRRPDLGELRAYLDAGPVRLLTLAPELPGAAELVAEANARGVQVALGHSGAGYEEAIQAFDQGVTQITHTYNGMAGFHHRTPGALGAGLTDDRVYAQLIADNVHVHPAAIQVLARCKGPEKTLLISDAIAAAGMEPGSYTLGGVLGGQAVTVFNGECRLHSGALAGSVLTLDAALRNFMAATRLPLGEAWVSTSLIPARALGLDDRYGVIAPDFAADLVVLDADCRVVATLVGGQVAYLRDPARLKMA